MVATREKRALFGGALRSAGLAAATMLTTSALADFTPAAGFNRAYIDAYGPASSASGFDANNIAAFTVPQSYSGPGLDMSAYAGTTLMSASITLTDSVTWNYGYSLVVQYFTVDDTKKVFFEWDFANAVNAVAYVYQSGFGVISTLALEGSDGIESLILTPGNLYAFAGFVAAEQGFTGGFVQLSNIPAPSALALLGLGMLGVRRRRRE